MFDEVHLVPRARSITALAGRGRAGPRPARAADARPTERARVEPAPARRPSTTSCRPGRGTSSTSASSRWPATCRPSPIGRLVELIDAETLASSRASGTRATVRGLRRPDAGAPGRRDGRHRDGRVAGRCRGDPAGRARARASRSSSTGSTRTSSRPARSATSRSSRTPSSSRARCRSPRTSRP